MVLDLSYMWYFCPSSRWIFVCLLFGFTVCLVSSFRNEGLAPIALGRFALRAHGVHGVYVALCSAEAILARATCAGAENQTTLTRESWGLHTEEAVP